MGKKEKELGLLSEAEKEIGENWCIIEDDELPERVLSKSKTELVIASSYSEKVKDEVVSRKLTSVADSDILLSVRGLLVALGYNKEWVEGYFREAQENYYNKMLNLQV